MTKLLSVVLLLILSTACIKTADQVNREKRFEAMTENMKDSQGLLGDVVGQMRDMQSQLDKMNGRMEELEHKGKQVDPQKLNQMNENVTLVQTQQEAQSAQLQQIQNELKEQRSFLEKVTATLSSAGKEKPAASKKKSAREELSTALHYIKTNKWNPAREGLESLIDDPELSLGDQNKLLHGLGRVEFFTANYEKALTYFSKIYTKYPKSSLAASSLLFIGRTLNKMGKKEEAREALAKVMDDYPGTKEATEAKQEL